MKYSTHHSTQWFGLLPILVAVLVIATTLASAGGLTIKANRSVILPVGRSTLMHFERMKRVQVIEPELVEVVVASLNDLSLYGKKAGETTIYVWDKAGLHQIEVTVLESTAAERLMQDLRAVLGPRLMYTPVGDSTLLIEGALPAADAQRAHHIIGASAREGVQVVDLVRAEGDDAAGAAAAVADSLRRILGDSFEYLVWNNNTLLVKGGLGDQEELAQAKKLLAAVSGATADEVKIVDLLEYKPDAAAPPVEQIARALGETFRVWQIYGRTVAVQGTVPNEAELANLNKILGAFSNEAEVISLVTVGKPDMNAALAAMQQILGNRIVVRPLDNEALIIDGTVATPEELARVREIIAGYPIGYRIVDLLRVALPEKRQVVVHVKVVDVNSGDLNRLGINWGQLEYSDDGTVTFIDQPWLIQNFHGIGLPDIDGFKNIFSIGSQLDLLRQQNKARILSQPNLMVDDGGEAEILVGGEIPVPVAQTGGGGSGAITVEWKPYGVKLVMQPTILEDGNKINLKIAPEVSSLDYANAVTIGGFVLPALRSRRATTTVTISSLDTLVLGGLLQEEETRSLRKIPLLGDLPIIGKLFQRKEFQRGESELLIMVTPEIVDRDAQTQILPPATPGVAPAVPVPTPAGG